MDRGVKMLTRIILVAFLLGVLVVVLHPAYRDTLVALWWGDIESSAIWDSNRAYYSEVTYETDSYREHAE